ncbi:hypothetical protein ACQKH8_07015, partial [Staphylococcus aureus]
IDITHGDKAFEKKLEKLEEK